MYSKNEIKQVIFRIDLEGNDQSLIQYNQNFIATVLQYYKVAQPEELDRQFSFTQDPANFANIQTIITEIITKKYTSPDGILIIRFNKNAIIFESSCYSSFEDFMANIKPIVKCFYEINDKAVISRIGLRFINIFSQNNYVVRDFSTKYKAFLTGVQEVENMKPIQSICHEEFSCDDIRAVINFGYYNPTAPSNLNVKDILLDIDAIHFGTVNNIEDVNRIIDHSHVIIKSLFNTYISDYMRKKLGEDDGENK